MLKNKGLIASVSAIAAMSVAAALTVGALDQSHSTEAVALNTVRARTIRVAPDVVLQVVERGDQNGTPVVLLHGLSDSWSAFNRLVDHLPNDLRLIAIDLRGHGESSKPATGYTMQAMAGDVDAVLDSLNVGPAYVVGHSMGSLVAQYVAAQRPNHTRGLVLIGSARGGAYIPGMGEFLGAFAQFSNDDAPVSEVFAREFQLSTLHVPVPAAFLDSTVAASLKLPTRVWKRLLQGIATDSGPRTRAHVRTLVMWGEKEAIMPRDEQTKLVQQYGASFEQFDATGHSPHWERPELAAQSILRFIKSTPR